MVLYVRYARIRGSYRERDAYRFGPTTLAVVSLNGILASANKNTVLDERPVKINFRLLLYPRHRSSPLFSFFSFQSRDKVVLVQRILRKKKMEI